MIRFCFAHNQQTYSAITCLVGGWRGMTACDVAQAEVTRFDDGEEG